MKFTISLVLFIICAIHAAAQIFSTNSGADNSILTLNNISKETLIGFGADLFSPKDALAVTPNYISSIMNSSNVGIYKISVTSTKKEDCPNKEKLVDICDSISLNIIEEEKKELYYYEWERKIFEASCVDKLNDSREESTRKVKIMWNKYENDLVCNNDNFDVTNGNILKIAVYSRMDSLLKWAAQTWRVNLNRVDQSDGMTVLDYVQKKIEAYKGTAEEKDLRGYYKILRDEGAKHASELKK